MASSIARSYRIVAVCLFSLVAQQCAAIQMGRMAVPEAMVTPMANLLPRQTSCPNGQVQCGGGGCAYDCCDASAGAAGWACRASGEKCYTSGGYVGCCVGSTNSAAFACVTESNQDASLSILYCATTSIPILYVSGTASRAATTSSKSSTPTTSTKKSSGSSTSTDSSQTSTSTSSDDNSDTSTTSTSPGSSPASTASATSSSSKLSTGAIAGIAGGGAALLLGLAIAAILFRRRRASAAAAATAPDAVPMYSNMYGNNGPPGISTGYETPHGYHAPPQGIGEVDGTQIQSKPVHVNPVAELGGEGGAGAGYKDNKFYEPQPPQTQFELPGNEVRRY
ncbi:MAG: hypothetical protein M1829_003316 [Trizodia sp. TS-e1964]|nr:MAG: hypothetical protein M1829_003316 [Trizodia sp. TS-e1964]